MDVRAGAYGVATDIDGRILLAHWNEGGRSGWTVPGGGIEDGESAEVAVVREMAEETGYDIVVVESFGTRTETIAAGDRILAGDGDLLLRQHFFGVRTVGGRLRDEVGGSTDAAAWFTAIEAAELPRVAMVDHALGLAARLSR